MRNLNQSKKSTIDGLNYFDLYISQAEENAKLRSIVSSLKNELTEKDNKIEVRIFFVSHALDTRKCSARVSKFKVYS